MEEQVPLQVLTMILSGEIHLLGGQIRGEERILQCLVLKEGKKKTEAPDKEQAEEEVDSEDYHLDVLRMIKDFPEELPATGAAGGTRRMSTLNLSEEVD